MACRVPRSYQDHTRRDLVSCCECGSAHLEVFSTAQTLEPGYDPTTRFSSAGRPSINSRAHNIQYQNGIIGQDGTEDPCCLRTAR